MSLSPIIVALDFPAKLSALNFANQLDSGQVRVKVGSELFMASGPAIVEELQALGFDVFLDLKFHDIPNTVASACFEAAKLGVWMTNVHASGGSHMMQAIKKILKTSNHHPIIIGVTVLTSTNDSVFAELKYRTSLDEQVMHLAALCCNHGLDGVVCSAHEARAIRQQLGDDLLLVTPGIRLASDSTHDQRRVMTPAKALAAGSDYLVVGRSITQSNHPQKTIETIIQQINTPENV